jgi:hypothetical protein
MKLFLFFSASLTLPIITIISVWIYPPFTVPGVATSCLQHLNNLTIIVPKGYQEFNSAETFSVYYPINLFKESGNCQWNPCSIWNSYTDPFEHFVVCDSSNDFVAVKIEDSFEEYNKITKMLTTVLVCLYIPINFGLWVAFMYLFYYDTKMKVRENAET